MSEKPSLIHVSVCLLAVAAGLFLRFHRLDQSLWFDEAVSVQTASVPVAAIPRELTRGEDSNPPLYPLLLKGWMNVFGESDAAIHALSAMIGVLAIVSTGWAAFALGGARAGLTAAALMSLHPWAVVFSQEARAYELLVVLALLSVFFLLEGLRTGEKGYWAAFSAATVLDLFTHNYAVFLLLAQGLSVVWSAREKKERLKPALSAIGISLLLYSPWIVYAMRQVRALPVIAPLGPRDILYTLYSEAGLWVMAGPMVCHWPPGVLAPLLCVSLAAFAYLLSSYNKEAAGLLIVAVFPVAVPMLVSALKPIYTTGRHNIVSLPPLVLLAALSVEAVPQRGWRLMILAFFLASWSYPLAAYASATKSYEREVAAFIEQSVKPGYHVVVSPEYRRVTLSHYYKELAAEESVPVASEKNLPDGLIIVTEYPRVIAPEQGALLEKRYRLVEKKFFGLSSVEVFVRRTGR